jgi:hypothetical protein
MDSEAGALIDCLDSQCQHVTGILEELTDEALHQSVLPSAWTCLGLVDHLALDVERFWFRQVVAAEGSGFGDVGDRSSAWDVPNGVPPEVVFERYHQEIGRADVVIAATALDAAPKAWPSFFGDWRLPDMGAVMLPSLPKRRVTPATSMPPANSSTDGPGSRSRSRYPCGYDACCADVPARFRSKKWIGPGLSPPGGRLMMRTTPVRGVDP